MQEIENIIDIENAPNYTFIKGDIVDAAFIDTLLRSINLRSFLAAELMDRSLLIHWLL
jgi:dTDP-glucose 4,6-dehydratase